MLETYSGMKMQGIVTKFERWKLELNWDKMRDKKAYIKMGTL